MTAHLLVSLQQEIGYQAPNNPLLFSKTGSISLREGYSQPKPTQGALISKRTRWLSTKLIDSGRSCSVWSRR
ncbi:g8577 [Coccomyxa elongata]